MDTALGIVFLLFMALVFIGSLLTIFGYDPPSPRSEAPESTAPSMSRLTCRAETEWPEDTHGEVSWLRTRYVYEWEDM